MARTKTFDYVIVGAGSAGCTLANRLTEDPDSRVLILEAGGWDRDPWIHIPLGWGRLIKNRLHDWMYFAEPNDVMNGRSIECARGKVVGGSSSINAMAYVRGHRLDFDRWAESGAAGWSYADVLPYFRKQESWEGGANDYRGGNGPLATQVCKFEDSLISAYGEAGKNAGYAWTEDYNGENQEGFGRLQMTIKNGRRSSGATAYLRPAAKRSNLQIVVKALARRIIFEGSRAVGIEYEEGGNVVIARADREVIISGGVVNSPQLLMLSGIGDPEELRRHGVSIQARLPGVGKNLQDQIAAMLVYERKIPGPFYHHMRFDRISVDLAKAYLFGKGFASDVPGGVTAFLKTHSDQKVPDIQLLMTAGSIDAWPYLQPFVRPFQDTFVSRVVLLHPESRGYIALASNDPRIHPKIHQSFLSTDKEWETLRAGFRMVREIGVQPVMAEFIKKELSPGVDHTTDSQIDEHIKNTAITVHHPLGTCKMGSAEDDSAVVDPELRVIGVEGLRVVDASVMPDAVSGTINAAVVMIAERAANLITNRTN